MSKFVLNTDKSPAGDQKETISILTKSIEERTPRQLLLGVTGSGKTFAVANIVKNINRPTLIIVHNKTLAAQWYQELLELFPNNSVQYYISLFDFYRPEAYIPRTAMYLEKESVINKEIQKLRIQALGSAISKRDTIIVSSVSCIFGAGNPESYAKSVLALKVGDSFSLEEIYNLLWNISYVPTDSIQIEPGTFRATSTMLDIRTFFTENEFIKLRFENNELISIHIRPKDSDDWKHKEHIYLFPATTYVIPDDLFERGLRSIKEEVKERSKALKEEGKHEEALRIVERTHNDLEFLREHRTCNGIENYSVHFSDKRVSEAPYTLLDFFPDDFLTIIDESHQTIPQMRAMKKSSYERIAKLVDFGYRLPSAHYNRPLSFEEAYKKMKQIVFVSATPSEFEINESTTVAEQIIRPTGLLDPHIEVRSSDIQIEDAIQIINECVKKKERVLVLAITKKMSEKISRYLQKHGIKSCYLHSELATHERIAVLSDLRSGEIDVIVGINLLREGLDLPEVAVVLVLNADHEGFLRSTTSLLQICGRASRNNEGRVIFYANNITASMSQTITESERRRKKQEEFNKKNNIVPTSTFRKMIDKKDIPGFSESNKLKQQTTIKELKKEMQQAASEHKYQKAIEIRDKIKRLRDLYRKK